VESLLLRLFEEQNPDSRDIEEGLEILIERGETGRAERRRERVGEKDWTGR
jgi:hypothetical protein